MSPPIVRPSRTHKRYLQKGESITVFSGAEALVSDDLSLSGEASRRVRVSFFDFSSLSEPKRAQYVDLRQGRITCVPIKYYEGYLEQSPHLSEIPWVEDPIDFSV